MSREAKKTVPDIGSEGAFLNVKDLEALLRIDQKTIYRYVALGLIPYVRIQSNIRFVRHQITAWIEEHNYRPKPRNSAQSRKR